KGALKLLEYLVEVQPLWGQRLPTAEREQVPGERSPSLSSPGDLLDEGVGRLGRIQPVEEQLAETEDRLELIIEVMGDATGQEAEGFQPSCLLLLRLSPSALGHVADENGHK